jgi:hypothetical protein
VGPNDHALERFQVIKKKKKNDLNFIFFFFFFFFENFAYQIGPLFQNISFSVFFFANWLINVAFVYFYYLT